MSSKLTPFIRPDFKEKAREAVDNRAASLPLRVRPRRNRKSAWSRALVCENVLTVGDLIWPLFLIEGEGRRDPVLAMPGVDRLSVDQAVREAERAAALNIPS